MRKIYLGRHVFGLAALAFGLTTFYWHDFNIWQQIGPLGNLPHCLILVYLKRLDDAGRPTRPDRVLANARSLVLLW